MKLLTKFAVVFDRTIGASAFLAAIALVFMWALLSSEVISRFLVNYSIFWTMDICETSLIGVTFLAAAWLLKKEGHIKIDLVYGHLKPRTRASLDTITSIIGVVVFLFFVWYGTKVTMDDFMRDVHSHTQLHMILWPRYAVIALGSLLLLIQFCRRAYANLLLWRRPEGKEAAPSEEGAGFY